jgi:hypothetical protein
VDAGQVQLAEAQVRELGDTVEGRDQPRRGGGRSGAADRGPRSVVAPPAGRVEVTPAVRVRSSIGLCHCTVRALDPHRDARSRTCRRRPRAGCCPGLAG